MVDFSLNVEAREELGKGANGRIRRDGKLPGIVYAHGMKSLPIAFSDREFVTLARRAGASQIFTLQGADPTLSGKPAIVKEIQRDPVKNRVLHVDFQMLRDDEEISLQVRLQFAGEAPGVKVDGGVLTISSHDLGVRCLPKFIPQVIVVDVSSLNVGEGIHASDIALPEGVALDGNPEESIVSVTVPRAAVEAAPAAAEGAATAEGAAAPEGAAGAAAPAAAAGGETKSEGGKK